MLYKNYSYMISIALLQRNTFFFILLWFEFFSIFLPPLSSCNNNKIFEAIFEHLMAFTNNHWLIKTQDVLIILLPFTLITCFLFCFLHLMLWPAVRDHSSEHFEMVRITLISFRMWKCHWIREINWLPPDGNPNAAHHTHTHLSHILSSFLSFSPFLFFHPICLCAYMLNE